MSKESMNLFWKQKEKPGLDQSDKENNVTHALLVTIKKNPKFLHSVLRKAGIRKQLNKYKVYFQVNKKRRSQTLDAEEKFILLISSKYNEAVTGSEEEKGTIPDGLVIDDNTSILIESKVTASKDHGQLTRYNNQFYNGEGKILDICWEDIHGLARKFSQTGKHVGDYLAGELHEYLEVINMAGFDGIPFFNKGESYDRDVAAKVFKRLKVDIENQNWFKRDSFVFKGRPLSGSPWDAFYTKTIRDTSTRQFPHFSIYVFCEIFALDMLFHKPELRKILVTEKLKQRFFGEIERLASNPDYILRIVHYRMLANKRESVGVRSGDSYDSLLFDVQLSRFIILNKKDWREKLTQQLQWFVQQDFKQISVMKKAHYSDKQHQNLENGNACMRFIEDAVKETLPLHRMMLDLYFERKKKKV